MKKKKREREREIKFPKEEGDWRRGQNALSDLNH